MKPERRAKACGAGQTSPASTPLKTKVNYTPRRHLFTTTPATLHTLCVADREPFIVPYLAIYSSLLIRFHDSLCYESGGDIIM